MNEAPPQIELPPRIHNVYDKPPCCGDCQSANLKKVSFVWEQQLTTGNTNTIGVGLGSGLMVGIADSTSRGTTLLGDRLTPPSIPSHRLMGWMAALAWLVFTAIIGIFPIPDYIILPVFWLGILASCFLPMFLRRRYARSKVYLDRVELWNNSWICMDCGGTWISKMQ